MHLYFDNSGWLVYVPVNFAQILLRELKLFSNLLVSNVPVFKIGKGSKGLTYQGIIKGRLYWCLYRAVTINQS